MKQKNWQRHEPAPQKLHKSFSWGFNTQKKKKKKAGPKDTGRGGGTPVAVTWVSEFLVID